MLKGRIIGVDVDLTVVRSDIGWYDWCNAASDFKHLPDDAVIRPYNFTKLYPDLDVDYILHYWRRADVYDKMAPIDGCVEALRRLAEHNDIVFVSTIKGNHHKSKVEFSKRNFPFMSGFLATKEKQYAGVDVMIDDRVDVLNKVYYAGKQAVVVNTPYDQSESSAADFVILNSWNAADVEDMASKLVYERMSSCNTSTLYQ